MKINDSHRKQLCEMMYYAFLELRHLGSTGKSGQAHDLADAFHNLPKGMWTEEFSLEFFRDAFLSVYQTKYPGQRVRDYVGMVNAMLAAGSGDHSTN
jgi:hypothetical protein